MLVYKSIELTNAYERSFNNLYYDNYARVKKILDDVLFIELYKTTNDTIEMTKYKYNVLMQYLEDTLYKYAYDFKYYFDARTVKLESLSNFKKLNINSASIHALINKHRNYKYYEDAYEDLKNTSIRIDRVYLYIHDYKNALIVNFESFINNKLDNISAFFNVDYIAKVVYDINRDDFKIYAYNINSKSIYELANKATKYIRKLLDKNNVNIYTNYLLVNDRDYSAVIYYNEELLATNILIYERNNANKSAYVLSKYKTRIYHVETFDELCSIQALREYDCYQLYNVYYLLRKYKDVSIDDVIYNVNSDDPKIYDISMKYVEDINNIVVDVLEYRIKNKLKF